MSTNSFFLGHTGRVLLSLQILQHAVSLVLIDAAPGSFSIAAMLLAMLSAVLASMPG